MHIGIGISSDWTSCNTFEWRHLTFVQFIYKTFCTTAACQFARRNEEITSASRWRFHFYGFINQNVWFSLSPYRLASSIWVYKRFSASCESLQKEKNNKKQQKTQSDKITKCLHKTIQQRIGGQRHSFTVINTT